MTAYSYGHGSLEEHLAKPALAVAPSTKAVRVRGINRASIRGSFLIAAYANMDAKKLHLGTEAVLSRWSVQGCMNCQTHVEAKAAIGLYGLADTDLANALYEVEVHTHNQVMRSAIARSAGTRFFLSEVR